MRQHSSAPTPGQIENCEICNKRFTVTPYSKSGPNGGLLCPKCAKELATDDQTARKGKKKAGLDRRAPNYKRDIGVLVFIKDSMPLAALNKSARDEVADLLDRDMV